MEKRYSESQREDSSDQSNQGAERALMSLELIVLPAGAERRKRGGISPTAIYI